MSTIGKLFGRSPFSQIQLHMEQVNKCIGKMSEALDAVKAGNFESLDRLSSEVSELEHEADQIKADIRERLLKRFFMPIGLPISTTHTLVGAVLGVGLARGINALNLKTMRNIVAGWAITIPAGAILCMIFFFILKLIFIDSGWAVGG